MNVTLYRKNRLGVGTWRVWVLENTIYIGHSQTVGGSEIIHTEHVPCGLGGRTRDEQIVSRVQSRINRQRDKGYVDTYEQAANEPLRNTLNQPPPMLAKKFDQVGWHGKYVMQPKLDGFRCLVARVVDDIIVYTRQGKVLTAPDHLIDLYRTTVPDGCVVDGELYAHGVPLQQIASWAKRKQSGTASLVHHVYDMMSDDHFLHRYSDLTDIVATINSPSVVLVPNTEIVSEDTMWEKFGEYRSQGYEGGILRRLDMPYESGCRSSGLIKVKKRHDAEFEVIDVVPGSDGLGILICKMLDGKTFKTVAPGTHGEKLAILQNKQHYIGRQITVEYANLTDDGIPFHAVAIRFREEL